MYSSSSSSECECDEYCTCTYGTDVHGNPCGYGRTPFYETMGHPFVYYAQVPQPSNKQRSRETRRDNNNCFSKAFRWYTQEHVPQRSTSPNKTDMSAFAAWLDSKYDEFLRDSQLDNVYHLEVKQTGIIETDKIPNNKCCEPRPKKFRVKSPWRRKRHNTSKEAGDTIQKQNQSFQFILQPKDLGRPASECRQPSNATMISTEIPMRYTIKTQSYSVISQEPAVCEEKKHECNADKSNKDIIDEKKTQHKHSQNISCQCSLAKVVKTNAQSQYENKDAERACDNQITSKEMFRLRQKDSPSLSNIQSSSKLGKTCPCLTEDEFVENLIQFPAPISLSCGGVQTSDHSIHFEKDDVHGYPLFMKIVCADKLCK